MEFANALGVVILVAGVILLIAYGIRHRGSISKWLENLDHQGNADEKDDQVLSLQRRKEDIEHQLKKLGKD